MTPTLTAGRVTLRPQVADDLPALVAMLREPEIAHWWEPLPDDAAAHRSLADGDVLFTVLVDEAVAGWLSVSEEDDPNWRAAGIDVFLGEAARGGGVGTSVMRLAVGWLLDDRGHHRLTIDPCAANARAIRVYEKVGFRPIGIARAYARIGDGSWADHLLMDLLATDVA